MQEVIEEELLSLGLGLRSTTWFPDGTNKRKRDKCNDEGIDVGGGDDKLLLQLIQTRDRMLRADAKIRGSVADGKGLHLIHLLLMSATAVDGNNTPLAVESLRELYQNGSINGDPIQRVAAYFADGLAARLVAQLSRSSSSSSSSSSSLYHAIMAGPTLDEELSAFTKLYEASPYYQFAHFTANQAIMEAFEEEVPCNGRSLHVVDFDVSYGFQWPSLIQSLSDMATDISPISLHITGFGRSSDELKETATQLANFAKSCHNLTFEFEGLLRGHSRSCHVQTRKGATLVVNLVFYLDTLNTSSEISDILMGIQLLRPSAVVVVEKEGNRSARSFLSGFMESLHYFAAMFDSLDDCLPAESTARLWIEKNHLGREIKNVIAGGKKHLKHERLETWKVRMEENGFEGVKLSSRSLSQAKLLLKIKSHCCSTEYGGNGGGFRIFEREEGRAISLGWQDRHLVTASAWRCAR